MKLKINGQKREGKSFDADSQPLTEVTRDGVSVIQALWGSLGSTHSFPEASADAETGKSWQVLVALPYQSSSDNNDNNQQPREGSCLLSRKKSSKDLGCSVLRDILLVLMEHSWLVFS